MTELQKMALKAGLFFGAWPLLMNKSGLPGNLSGSILGFISFLVVTPFAMQGFTWSLITESNWIYAVLAGVASGVGVIFFNGGLAVTTTATVSNFFVMMIVVQVSVSAVYQIIVTQTVTPEKFFGFILAGGAAYLLSK